MRNLRATAIISLVLYSIFVAATNGLAAHSRWIRDSQASDSVSKWEKRVKPVLDHIPNDITELGYVADWDIPDSGYNLIDQDNEYTLTQYALAPRIVQPGWDHEWMIGNFTDKDFQKWLDKNLSSYRILEIGFGIYLIHRTSP